MNSSMEKLFEDIEAIKKDIKAIKEYLEIAGLKEEVKKEIEKARERIKRGEYISQEELTKEFENE